MHMVLRVIQYIPRNMHTVFALLCFVVFIHWLIFPYPSGLLHWHCGNLTIAPVPAKQPWWIWINTSCEFIMNDCITTTKQSTTKPCAYFLGYTVCVLHYNMVRWISAPGTMHFCPQYDTFWPCGLFTLLQFCKHPPYKISMKLRWVSSVNLVNCGDIFNLLTILSSPEINDSF